MPDFTPEEELAAAIAAARADDSWPDDVREWTAEDDEVHAVKLASAIAGLQTDDWTAEDEETAEE